MAQYFLAGVANAEIFDQNGELFATAKTLTDSSLQTSVSAEEVRGGKGAALIGKYFHTTGLTLTLTDALFRMEYIAANIGADFVTGTDVIVEESHVAADGKITLDKDPKPFGCTSSNIVWYKAASADAWTKITLASGRDITGLVNGVTYCVKYFATNASAKSIKVNTNFVPKTLYVLLTATLFAGDAKSQSGTEAGKVVIKVPRFQLDGQQELAMNMTGASTTAFTGSALAVDCDDTCNSNGGYYAEIIEVIDGYNWESDIIGLAADKMAAITKPATGSVTKNLPDVYALIKNSLPKKVDVVYALESEATDVTINGKEITVASTASAGNIDVIATYPASGAAVATVKFVVTIA